MAKITHSTFAEKGFLGPFKKEFSDATKETDKLTQAVAGLNKELASTKTIQSSKDLEKLSKITAQLTKIETQLIAVEEKKSKIINNSIKAVKKREDQSKNLNQSKKNTIEIDKKIIKEEEKLSKLNSDKVQDLVQLQRLTKEQNTINKETEQLSQKNIGTLKRISIENKKLRREREGLNLETAKGRKRLLEINKTLDKNNKIILKNSDAQKKAILTTKGYGDSLKDAAGASGLFGRILGPLAAAQGTLNALMKKNVVQNEASAVATKANAASTAKLSVAQRASALATGIGTKALKLFKFALASTGIGLLVVALAALIGFFTRSQKGVDFLAVKMAGLGAAVDVIIDVFSEFGEAIFDALSNPKKLLDDFFEFLKGIPKLILDNIINRVKAFGVIFRAIADGDLKAIADGFLQLGTGVEDFTDKAKSAINSVKDAANDAAESVKKIARELELEIALAEKLKKLTIELTREQKLFEAEQATGLRIAKEQELISKDKLRLDKDRVAALEEANRIFIELAEKEVELQERALAASLDSLAANGESLGLDKERLEFINAIKEGRIDAATAVKQAADFTLSSAAGEEALFEIVEKIKLQEQAKLNLIAKQVKTTKQLSSLQVQIATKNAMAVIREAAALRQLAQDQELSLQKRIDLLTEAAAKEIEGFRIQKDANIKNEQELAAAKLQINAKLQADIKKLLEKGGVGTDFEAIARKQVAVVNQIEQELLQQDIERLQRRLEIEELTISQRIALQEELFATMRTKAQFQSEFIIATETKTAEEIELINLELAGELEDINNARLDAIKKTNEEILKEEEKTNDERKDEALKTANEIVDATLAEIKKINKAKNEALDNEVDAARDSVAIQTRIAQEGGENILAEEEARLAKARLAREIELERQAKQEQAIALAQAFVNSFAAHSKDDPKGALAKALRDTFLAKGIAAIITGSFAEGTEDTGTVANPIDSKGGRLTLTHDNERIMTAAQNKMTKGMSNDDLAKLAQDYHNGNTWSFPQVIASNDNSELIKEVQNIPTKINQALKDYQSTSAIDWDSRDRMIERKIKNGQKQVIKHMGGRKL